MTLYYIILCNTPVLAKVTHRAERNANQACQALTQQDAADQRLLSLLV